MIFDILINCLFFRKLAVNEPDQQALRHQLIQQRKSMVRWGDGEISLIHRVSIGYQEYSPELATELERILTSDNNRLLIASPNRFVTAPLFQLLKNNKLRIWMRSRAFFIRYRHRLANSADAFGFRSESCFSYLPVLRELCGNYHRVVVVSSNQQSEALLRETLGYQGEFAHVAAQSKNTFTNVPVILKNIERYESGSSLIICACGPASKILVDQLSALNFQCIDVGHLFDHFANNLIRNR